MEQSSSEQFEIQAIAVAIEGRGGGPSGFPDDIVDVRPASPVVILVELRGVVAEIEDQVSGGKIGRQRGDGVVVPVFRPAEVSL